MDNLFFGFFDQFLLYGISLHKAKLEIQFQKCKDVKCKLLTTWNYLFKQILFVMSNYYFNTSFSLNCTIGNVWKLSNSKYTVFVLISTEM